MIPAPRLLSARGSDLDYDRYLYSDMPYPETHPGLLAAMGTLHGLRPPRPDRCRVLELGCALGTNLVGMAATLPESRFWGIDLSPRQIAAGQEIVAELGLGNIELRAQDISDFGAGAERFDYILCHGVYSWVPEAVQDKILRIVRQHLQPHGIAYVSFNVLPGWHLLGALRDLLRRHVGTGGTPEERVARAREYLSFLKHIPDEQTVAQAFLFSEVQRLDQLPDAYLYYEHLGRHNRPQYFGEFAAGLRRAGLQYLGDAYFAMAAPGRHYAQMVCAATVPGDPIETEQRLDVLEARYFRASLLCHEEAKVERGPSWTRLRRLFLASHLTPRSYDLDPRSEEEAAFQAAPDLGVSVYRPILKAALKLLHEHRPRGLRFDRLLAGSWDLVRGRRRSAPPAELQRELGTGMMDLLLKGYLDLHSGVPEYATRPGPRPATTALVRLQARRGLPACTSLRHESVFVDDFDRALLPLLDGKRSAAAVARALFQETQAGWSVLFHEEQPVTTLEDMNAAVRSRLAHLGRAALLIA